MQLSFLLLLGSLVSVIFYHVTRLAYELLFSPHRTIPGPLLARFTKLYYLYHVWLGDFESLNIELHRHYNSPIVRVAPGWYSIKDSAALKTVYGHGTKFAKSEWYEGWKHPDPSKFTLFTERNIKFHAQNRRLFQGMYSMSALVSYESYVDECAAIFAKRLREFAESGQVLDMTHWFQCYAFDVIGDITYSKRFGFLDRGEDIEGVLSALQSSMVYSTLIGVYAKLHPYAFKIMNLMGSSGARARTYLMQFGQKMIGEKQKNSSIAGGDHQIGSDATDQPVDLLTKFLNDFHSGKSGWTMYHVLAGCMSNIIAGSDTTAVSLSSILYHLLKNPQAMYKLRAEILDFQAQKGTTDENITFKESQNMKYLQAVIKEALRLHPATGLPLWRIVPKEGAKICGYWFKGGEIVGVNTWVMHYDRTAFGDDATEFRPERWLDTDEQKLKDMEHAYMPFGLGSRTCIGKNISMLEMCKLIPQLVRQFDFVLENPNKSWQTANYWFVKQLDFFIKVQPRNK